ncbi:hypothetical protein ACFLQN_03650 [Candidatus Aenigmatarchaeota archaeon]
MTIISYDLYYIKANITREQMKEKKLEVNSFPRVLDVKKKTGLPKTVKEPLQIDFEFETKYEPDLGNVVLKGEILYHGELLETALEEWQKSKTLNNEISLEVMNAIMRKSLIKVLAIADELKLPPPVNLPVYKLAEKEENK